MLGSVKH